VVVPGDQEDARTVVAGLAAQPGFAPIEPGRIGEGGRLIRARDAPVLQDLVGLERNWPDAMAPLRGPRSGGDIRESATPGVAVRASVGRRLAGEAAGETFRSEPDRKGAGEQE